MTLKHHHGKIRLYITSIILFFSAHISAAEIIGIQAIDQQFSANAERLTDGTKGTASNLIWDNAVHPWSNNYFPMMAVLDLGGSYKLDKIEVYSGNIPINNPLEAIFEYTNNTTMPTAATSLVFLASETSPIYNDWKTTPLSGQVARFIRVRFNNKSQYFNIADIKVYGTSANLSSSANISVSKSNGTLTYTPGTSTVYTISVINAGPDAANGTVLQDTIPSGLNNAQWICSPSGGAVCPNNSGNNSINQTINVLPNGGVLTYSLTAQVSSSQTGSLSNTATVIVPAGVTDPQTSNNSSTDTDTAEGTSCTYDSSTSFQADVPANCNVSIGGGFNDWTDSTSAAYIDTFFLGSNEAACITLHNRFWTLAPNNKAYHTWHPAITKQSIHGLVCDFGHEHGYDPKWANTVARLNSPANEADNLDYLFDDMFEYSGGYPPFGYTVDIAANNGSNRHEDHVGHKVNVAHFRASIGSSSDSPPLYDSGFECVWLSKIHQGSHTMDAFSNHLHEYFLSIRCTDGKAASGNLNGTVGTEFSTKSIFTYGLPNQFKDMGTSTVHHYSEFVDPEGNALSMAHQTSPIGVIPNFREFRRPSGFFWNPMMSANQIDLWTEHVQIEIEAPTLPNARKITISPYYIVKNPARVVNPIYPGFNDSGQNKISRTIDLCYKSDGSKQMSYQYCADAPFLKSDLDDWKDSDSPFNGTLRSINFKNVTLENDNGSQSFCTTPFGKYTNDSPPCASSNILQKANTIKNQWNEAVHCTSNNQCSQISGSIWSKDGRGNYKAATPNGSGGYNPQGLGFEFTVDHRDPDDDLDGSPDGAHIRGEN